MFRRALWIVPALALALALVSGCKENQHDNSRIPAEGSFSDKPIQNHRFDGNATNPYSESGEPAEKGEGKGEKKASR